MAMSSARRPPNTSTVPCSGCHTLLSYATGAQSVRCVLCSTVTDVRPVSHLICGGCRTVLAYPSGAASVRCAVCDSLNTTIRRDVTAVVRCVGCNTDLNYPSGASSVRCSLCHHINQVRGGSRIAQSQGPGPLLAGLQQQQQQQEGLESFGRKSSTLYVIQNPCKDGEECFNMAIGLKIAA
ncbi:hypothetical protein HOP50_12g66380 [Chloropicon primus]|uniref:Zinc finger LSD1-type domain-containing protein n=1 Tax=Chloropicon primus TaxID=1764295 RepID=A0A5B8MXA8_9CHLO|nr:hypothetical protein A3770_12p66180 [Chloropicon primus]UPR03309.1 hypothetical protein HOP50_12g66380 [Chloropicon primus]|eukprot:QDZ24100.1 hypothetical protein A3770_12p66180 [Chloropicon primus]